MRGDWCCCVSETAGGGSVLSRFVHFTSGQGEKQEGGEGCLRVKVNSELLILIVAVEPSGLVGHPEAGSPCRLSRAARGAECGKLLL
jgi:hypothetical protein